jgi:hypothetical protein
MNYGGHKAQPSGGGSDFAVLPDGMYQAKCISAEYREDAKNGQPYAMCKCIVEVMSPDDHKGKRMEVMGYAREGDEAAIKRLGNMLYNMGYTELALEYARDVINSDSGPVGMVFEIRVKTSSQGTKFVNFWRRVAERLHDEQPTPYDDEPEPSAPADGFPF